MPSKITPVAALAAILVAGAALARPANASPDDACSLLAKDQVSAALSAPVGAGSYQGTYKKTCTWRAASGASYVTLMLEGADAFQAGKLTGSSNAVTITPVSGIGDDAYFLAVFKNVGLIVKKGNVAFKVAVYASVALNKKQAIEKTLAQQVLSKL